VRSGNVVGGGDLSQDRLLADVVRARVSDSSVQIRNLNSTRPWQHVLDPLHGYLFTLAGALTDMHADSFNFGPTDPSLRVKEVLDIALEFWPDLKIEIKESSSGGYESHLLDLDSSYARKVLGWEPKFSQRESILETLRWWQEILFEEKDCLAVVDRNIKEFLNMK
jgi:CDP-glucose 4,6-dehydratase